MTIGLITAQTLKSPNGNFVMHFSLNEMGTPTYELHYKGLPVIKPSKLGLELIGNSQEEFNTAIKNEKANDASLYDGFQIVDTHNSTSHREWS